MLADMTRFIHEVPLADSGRLVRCLDRIYSVLRIQGLGDTPITGTLRTFQWVEVEEGADEIVSRLSAC